MSGRKVHVMVLGQEGGALERLPGSTVVVRHDYQCEISNGWGRFNTPAHWVDTAATCDVRSKDPAPGVNAASALPKLVIDTKGGVTNFRWILVVCPENMAKHLITNIVCDYFYLLLLTIVNPMETK